MLEEESKEKRPEAVEELSGRIPCVNLILTLTLTAGPSTVVAWPNSVSLLVILIERGFSEVCWEVRRLY